ncbi:DUF2975 domain-containing protein [Gracilimonas sp.]|uniref:DUF2975 domain-containing protein n=1 Tax=Gracilimonas sp. TaxID=1974203 RepID=UPI002871EA25|nr:DUF2975 domain-containing protein [Gracilimonas sp.]
MDLNKKIFPDSIFRKVIIGLLLIFTGISIWASFIAFQGIHSILNKDHSPVSTAGMESYGSHSSVEFSSFRFSQTANLDTTFTYVTLKDITLSVSNEEALNMLSSSLKNEMVLGISSHPTFVVSDSQRSFWATQVYMEMGFLASAFILMILAIIWILSFQIEEYRKLFTTKIYRWVMTFFFLIFSGFMIDALLYARKINFLNTEFNLGLSPTGGISLTMMFVLFLLLFVLIFLRKGIPMQNEQDLTV